MAREAVGGRGEERTDEAWLVPIEEVARAFGMRTSALRYYERRGLLSPAGRRSGRRWYAEPELRRLAALTFWQQSGLMSLDQVTALLDEDAEPGRWKQVVTERRAALAEQIARMTAARDYLEHLLVCPREHYPDGCPHFEHTVWQPRERRLREAASGDRSAPAGRRVAGSPGAGTGSADESV